MMMIGDSRSTKGERDFGVRIKDLWQWDREGSGSGPDTEPEQESKTSAKMEEGKVWASKEAVLPRRTELPYDTTLGNKTWVKTEEKKDKGASIKEANQSQSKPKWFSSSEWKTKRKEMSSELKIGEWAYHCNSKAMWWSSGLHRLFDVNPTRRTKKLADYASLIHEDDKDLVQFLFDRAVNEGANYSVTHRIALPTKEGRTIIWCHCICRVNYSRPTNARCLKSQKSKDIMSKGSSKTGRYLVGVVQDVTSTINDSKISLNLKSYINAEEVKDRDSPQLVDSEIVDASPVCRLS